MKLYWTIRKVFAFLFRLLAHLEVQGVEHIPAEGAFILVSNHVSRLDSPVLMVALPRYFYVLAASEYRRFPPFAFLFDRTGAGIWVRRGEPDREALDKALAVLRAGYPLGIAPEGTRSRNGILQQGKPGVTLLAAKAEVPLIPLAVTGTETMVQDFSHLRRMRIRVVIGEPFTLPKTGRLTAAEREACTNLIMNQIAALLPPERRGIYAGLTPSPVHDLNSDPVTRVGAAPESLQHG